MAGSLPYPSNDEVASKLRQLTSHVTLVNASDLSLRAFQNIPVDKSHSGEDGLGRLNAAFKT